METIASKDPRAHTANVRKEFQELIDHLRGDIKKMDEPKAQALFETAAEVINGLDIAFITKRRARTPGNRSRKAKVNARTPLSTSRLGQQFKPKRLTQPPLQRRRTDPS